MTKKIQSNENRRQFLKLMGGGAIVVPLFGLDGCSKQEPSAPPAAPEPTAAPAASDTTSAASASSASSAADAPPAEPTPAASPAAAPAAAAATGPLPHLAESDPVAKALGYHQDASSVEGAKYPQHVAGQACHKCVQFHGAPGAAWGPCNIFSANLVNANGWCTAFAAKA